LQIVDGLSIVNDRYPQFSSTAPVLLHLDGSDVDMISFKESLLQAYPASHTLYSLSLAYPERGLWSELQITNLSSEREYETLHIPPLAADSTLENFMHVIAKLRAPDGCPWDRKQTHESLRRYLLEETYEAIERLDNNDLPGLQEELGDLLLQIALHAEIAWESGSFDMTSVLQGINRKIVSRHPHVFSSVVVKDEGDVLRNWDKIKELERSEKGDETQSGLLDGVPAILPALSQAQSLQERAARVGFDWPDIKPVIDKVFEEFEEIKQAPDAPSRAGELGDLLFAVVNLVRWYGVDAENALRQTNTKFRRRFAYIEKEATTAGRNLRDMTLEEMDLLWEAAKTPEKNQKSS
jgi:tetrapyrrole methylase family protein/MazG family protein